MKVKYSCTFEFDLQPPVTHRGVVVASMMPTCFARATREAAKAHPGLRWSSMVCVLLERVDTVDEAAVVRRRSEGGSTDSGNMDYPPA